ncbi:hypothetical protein SAMN05443668_101204 [Cryptosporangium aurantiacum]|uniref:Uncharacterized protein n=1 Tax=Cryptosporangium aurantiacum TaxID=134849 RepID=A0A1M7HIZ8_9ACTN|nr:hypothetical protein SAMN05443668_101204 [Cryptosporangium aurantiacum]
MTPGRPLVAACAAAAIVLGSALAVFAAAGHGVGGGSAGADRPIEWVLLSCLLAAAIEGAVLRPPRRRLGAPPPDPGPAGARPAGVVSAAVAVVVLVGGAVVWPFGAGLLAAALALAFVPDAIGSALALSARDLVLPTAVFCVTGAAGFVALLPATGSAAVALWVIAGAAAATALTVRLLGRPAVPDIGEGFRSLSANGARPTTPFAE